MTGAGVSPSGAARQRSGLSSMEGDMRGVPLAGLPQLISLGSRSGMLEIIRREAVHRIIFTGGTITGLTSDGWTVAQELRDAPLLPPEVLTSRLAVHASF